MPNYSYLPSLNFNGSSGYGTDGSGRYVQKNSTAPYVGAKQMTDTSDYGVYDQNTGKVVSALTGKPWSGKEPTSGKTYNNGVPVEDTTTGTGSTGAIDPNNAAQRYKAVDVVKSQPVSDATAGLEKTFTSNAANALKGFDEYLKNFQSDLTSARGKAAAATDITPTVSALGAAASRYGQGLDAAQQQASDALLTGAANERGVIASEQAELPAYDAAANAIEDRQLQAVQANLERYKMGSGTPMSAGSAESNILAKNAADVLLPIEQAKIQRRYDIMGRELPMEQSITGRNVSYGENFLPGVAGSRYSSETGLANAVQSLRQQVASMSYQQAVQFMQSAGVPAQVQQQVLSSQIGQLGQLGQLEDQSHYRGLQDLLGVNVSQPQFFSQANGGYPTYTPSRYSPQGGGGGVSPQGGGVNGAAPTQGSNDYNARLSAMDQYRRDLAAGMSEDAARAKFNRAVYPGTGTNQNQDVNPDGSQNLLSDAQIGAGFNRYRNSASGITYNPATGRFEDANGNDVGGYGAADAPPDLYRQSNFLDGDPNALPTYG